MRRDGRETRERGFTLIEIMAVVLIIGLLSTLVSVFVFRQVDKGMIGAARLQLKLLATGLEDYRMENWRYPTTEQGLQALVEEPTIEPLPKNYAPGGYLQGGKVPLDPWGGPYRYEYPGQHNEHHYDLWSYGADGVPGGEGIDADIGNWSDEEFGG